MKINNGIEFHSLRLKLNTLPTMSFAKSLSPLTLIILFVICGCKQSAEHNHGGAISETSDSLSLKSQDSISSFAVYASTDFGKSWEPMSIGLPANLKVIDIEKVGHELVLASENAGLFMTFNNKSSWKDISTGLATKIINTLYVKGDEIYIGLSHEGVTMWKLNSSYWNSYNSNMPNRNVRAIIKVGDELVIGTDMGIFKSNDHIQSWTGKFVGEPAVSLVMTGDTLYAGTAKGVLISLDGGEHWKYVHKGGSIHSLTLQGNNLYALYSSGDVFMGSNQGRTWKEIEYSPRDQSYIHSLVKAGDHFLMSNNHGVFQSANGKKDWQLVFTTEKYWFVDMVADDQVVYGAAQMK